MNTNGFAGRERLSDTGAVDETAENPVTETAHEAEATAAPASSSGDPIFDALWGRVLAAWEDEKVHQALLQHALTTQILPDLAGRYRLLSNDEAKAPIAKKRLDALVVAATQMLYATKSPERQPIPRSINLSAAGICLVVIAFAVYAYIHGR